MQQLYSRPWNKELDPDRFPAPSSAPLPPPVHHQRLDGKCTAKETFITRPLWDEHSQDLLVQLVRGACVDRAGASCQYNIKPHWASDQGFTSYLSDLSGTLCFQLFKTTKPASSSTDILVAG